MTRRSMKRTKWFVYGVKPVHVGAYEVRIFCPDGTTFIRLIYWDGRTWSGCLISGDQWRGLIEEPK